MDSFAVSFLEQELFLGLQIEHPPRRIVAKSVGYKTGLGHYTLTMLFRDKGYLDERPNEQRENRASRVVPVVGLIANSKETRFRRDHSLPDLQ